MEGTAESTVEWDVCRRTKWAELLPSFQLDKGLKEMKDLKTGEEWLGQVEINTHDPNLRPLWANPQFNIQTFQLKESPKGTLPQQFLFYQTLPKKTLEVRRNEPLPFVEG